MTTVKSLAIVALLVGGTSLAIAQGPPTGGYPPVAHGAGGEQVAPGPNVRVPTTRSHFTTRHQRRTNMIRGCAVGQQAAATCACGTAANGRPLLCQQGQWCHYPFINACTQ